MPRTPAHLDGLVAGHDLTASITTTQNTPVLRHSFEAHRASTFSAYSACE
jgi:hypothetical protein